MSSDWQVYQLDDLCEFINGYAFKSTDYVLPSEETVEVFRMGYISRGGRFKEDSTPVFVPKKYGKNLDKYFLKPKDVVIAMTDMKDKVAILGNTAWISHANRFVLNQRVGCIRVKRPDLLYPRFFYFYSNSLPHVEYLRTRANSGVQVNLSTSAIKESQIQVPPLGAQIEIADLLGALDDRITLLRETNATLEAIAQAMFKSWFVDFDSVHAKQQGLAPEGMSEATAALFPDSFEESELGLVPRGWKVGSLANLATLNPESWSAKNHPDTLAYIDLANAKDNEIAEVTEYVFDEAPSRARRVLRDGDTIIGTVRPGNRSFAFIHDPSENLTASTGFAVLRPTQIENTEFVYLASTQDASIEHLAHLAHLADGAAYPAVRPDVVAGIQCVLPSADIMQNFHDVSAPLLSKVSDNKQQAQTLATLRDTLLPRLISGQLRLPEAQSQIEEALA